MEKGAAAQALISRKDDGKMKKYSIDDNKLAAMERAKKRGNRANACAINMDEERIRTAWTPAPNPPLNSPPIPKTKP